ncbi:MAG: hypothetical protein Q4E75_05045 [bacterium]|nr:hypothetical protein [bacterium]
MKLKTKEFRKYNYFVLYEYNHENDLNDEDEIICYLQSWDELHKKYLKDYKASDLVCQYNKRKTNIINVIIDNKLYKLATFKGENEK